MSETLRVAHVITQLELGGAQQNTLYTVSHLDKQRFAPMLLCGRGGMLDEETMQSDSPLHFIPSLVRRIEPIKDIAALIHLYKLLRVLKPHIVHTHSSKAGILGRIAAYLAGVPVIIHTFHGFGFTPAQSPTIRRLFVILEKACARLSTHLIFVSTDNVEEAKRLGIGLTIPSEVIRSGIDIRTPSSVVASPVRSELGIPAEATLVLAVGNFKPQKNPMDLAKVAAIVLKTRSDVHFLLAGDGELRPEVEAFVQTQGIQANVHFLGWRRDTSALYAASTLYLLTSLWEGLPRSILEASVAGLPSVAYGVNGVRDILEDGVNGFLIPAGHVDLAAEKILWLAMNPTEAKSMGKSAHQRIQNEFDINEMVRRQERLYDHGWSEVPMKEHYRPRWSVL